VSVNIILERFIINDKSLYEKGLFEEVPNPEKIENRMGSEYTWFCETDDERTYIYANFHQYDPNREK